MPPDAVISAESLTKSYGAFKALHGVDLEVGRGEIFGFLGPNGAGKTTTIRCLLDLIRPDGGSLQVLGLDPQQSPVEVRTRCGYLPGELRLDENVRVETALRFFQQLRGDSVELRKRANEIAERLTLKVDARIKNLSKGNKQKLGIVAAMMHDPELLLLDEPTSGLDPLVQQSVLELVREARDGGTTVFFSSHVLAEVQGIADRVAIIREGEIVATGRTAELVGDALARVRVRFARPTEFNPPAGVALIQSDGCEVELNVEGSMDALVKALAEHEVASIETHQASLEDVFLAHYDPEVKPK
jgi:ABC-2 type transport system ATP-binding protein